MVAEPGLAELITTTSRNRSGVLKDSVSNNNAIFVKLQDNDGFQAEDGGRTLIEETAYQENLSFLWYLGGQQLITSFNATMTAPEFPWRQCAVAVTMTGLEQRQNSGSEAVLKLMASRMTVAENTIKNQVNSSMYGDGTGAGGKAILGLDALVSKTPSSGILGGIDTSTTAGAYYRNYALGVIASFGAPKSASNIKQVYTRAKIQVTRNGEGPNLGVAGNTDYESIMTASQATQQIYDTKLASLGFENIVFCGVPIVLGGGANLQGETLISATDSYLLNTKYLKFRYHKDCFMDVLEERASANQDAIIKFIALMANMTVSVRALQARIFDS